MRMGTIKFIDKWAGLVLCALFAPVEWLLPRRKKGPIKKILVIKFWGIGSIIMTGYLLRRIKASAPDAQIDLATISSNREAALMVGGAERLVILDISKGPVGIAREILRFLWQVRRNRYDVVLDLEYLTRFTALVSFATGAPVRAGFYARGFYRGNFHNERVPFNPYWHVRENFLNIGKAVGFDAPVPACLVLDPGPEGRVEIGKFREMEGITQPYIVINPNAGETSLERRWPAERFGALARKIQEELGMTIVVIGAADEYEVAMEVVKSAGARKAINAAGKTTVRGLAALLEGASALVSNDSGPLHIASHVGTPVVGLYGPETPVLWGPIRAEETGATILYRNLDCSPCINVHNMKTVVCLRKGSECLLDIGVDEVFEALKKTLAEGKRTCK